MIKVQWESFYKGLVCGNNAKETAEDDEISAVKVGRENFSYFPFIYL